MKTEKPLGRILLGLWLGATLCTSALAEQIGQARIDRLSYSGSALRVHFDNEAYALSARAKITWTDGTQARPEDLEAGMLIDMDWQGEGELARIKHITIVTE